MVQIQQPQVEMVEHITSHITSERLREAFLRIPRDLFVPFFYERLPTAGKQQTQWAYRKRSDFDTATWQQKIYQDTSLITGVDTQGHPSTSSSQPTIMARMLGTLDVRPGHRVLEIGTGTGYNAALIAYLTENPRLVTTLDIAPQVVRQARSALSQWITPQMPAWVARPMTAISRWYSRPGGMTVVRENGLAGYTRNAPYDRIIATGSHHRVPQAWIDQLASGGLLVMNLRTTLANVMLLVETGQDGTAKGTILPYEGVFMELHDGRGSPQHPKVPLGPLKHVLDASLSHELYPDALEHNYDFRFFLYCHFPQMWRFRIWKGEDIPFLYLADVQNHRLVQFYDGSVRGSLSLWEQLQEIAQEWEQLGRPRRQQYTMQIAPSQQVMLLGDRRFPL